MTTFNFTDRASYLAWRSEWKANYATISTTIRHLKGERSETNRAWAKLNRSYHEDEAQQLWRKFCIARTALARMQSDAREALETLKEAKKLSCSMRYWQKDEQALKDHIKDLQEPVLS